MRIAAGGLFTFIQLFDGPDRYGALGRFEITHSRPSAQTALNIAVDESDAGGLESTFKLNSSVAVTMQSPHLLLAKKAHSSAGVFLIGAARGDG